MTENFKRVKSKITIVIVMFLLMVTLGMQRLSAEALADNYFGNEHIAVEVVKEYQEKSITYTVDAKAEDEGVVIETIILPSYEKVISDNVTYEVYQNSTYLFVVNYTVDGEPYSYEFVIEEEDMEDLEIAEVENAPQKSEFTITDNVVKELPISATVNSKAELSLAIANAGDNNVIQLTELFYADLFSSPTPMVIDLALGDVRNIIIDGGDVLMTVPTTFTTNIFKVVNNGTGVLTIKNMKLSGAKRTVLELTGTGSVTLRDVIFMNGEKFAVANGLGGTLNVFNSEFKYNKGTAVFDSSTAVGHIVNIDNSYFLENKQPSGNNGGAVMINSNATASITNTSFVGNEVSGNYTGGALAINSEAYNINMTVDSSYFYNNAVDNNVGGAIAIYHLKGGNIAISNSIFEENKSNGTKSVADGAAIAIKNNSPAYSGTITISGSDFIKNRADDNGGAMLIEASNGGNTIAHVYNNTFVGNQSNNLGNVFKSGVGGAIQTYDSPKVVISHNTFYRNRSNNAGSGGAIGLSGSNREFISPVVANNIFVDNNYHKTGYSRNVAMKGVKANVANNGNVGYDAGEKFIPDDEFRNSLVKVENIFTKFYQEGEVLPSFADIGDAIPITYGDSIGYKNSVSGIVIGGTHIAYVPSPRIDEMLRTNDPRTITGVLVDARNYPREKLTVDNPYYPNAGSIEIFWARFDTGLGAWSSKFNVEEEDGVESLAYEGQFYMISEPPTFDGNGNPIYSTRNTFTRKTLVGPDRHGFVGWQNDNLESELKDVNEPYESRKQTFVAQWKQDVFHLDFELNDGVPAIGHDDDFTTQVINEGVNGNLGMEPSSKPLREGYEFIGWYVEDDFTGDVFEFTTTIIQADITLYAKWLPANETRHRVDFDSQGGSAVDSITNITCGSKIMAPQVPIKDGYQFIGWDTDEELTTEWNFESDEVTTDIILYAEWKIEDNTPDTGVLSKNVVYMAISFVGISCIFVLRKKEDKKRSHLE